MGLTEFKDIVSEADMILVGIGEEFLIPQSQLEDSITYRTYLRKLENEENKEQFTWIVDFIKAYYLKEEFDRNKSKHIAAYESLLETIKNKNFFIVTLNSDGIISKVGFEDSRIVSPCGSYEMLQCSEKCSNHLWDAKEEVSKSIENLLDHQKSLQEMKPPICPLCGAKAYFNVISNDNYVEGYIEEWNKYTKWLSMTLNKKLCIMELGVGFHYPSVIRWPFEKIAYFNEKVSFMRINAKFPQLSKEFENRNNIYSIAYSPLDFLLE